MLGSPISDYDWNNMRAAQNAYAAKQLGHPVDESQIKVGYGGAIPGAGADDSGDSGGIARDDSAPALAGLMRGLSSSSAKSDAGGNGDWLAPYGDDRELAVTSHELALAKANQGIQDIKYPTIKTDEARAASSADFMRHAQDVNEADARYGGDQAVRALQRHVQDMAGVNEEQGREYWSPMQQGKRQQGIEDALTLSQPKVDIAGLNAGGKVGAADAAANARLGAAGIAADSRQGVATTAAAGRIAGSGYASQPEAAAVLKGLQSAVGSVPPVGSFGPDVEQRIAAAAKLGVSRADAIAKLQQTGVIPRR